MEKEIKDLEEAVEKIQERLAELKEIGTLKRWRAELKAKVTPTRWRAEKEGNYFLINTTVEAEGLWESFDNFDNQRYEIGNYFKTEKEAEQKIEHLKIEQQLKDIALRLNNGVEIDWENDKQWKYVLYYDFDDDIINDDYFNTTKYQGIIYCIDENFKDIAIAEIGEDRLEKYLKEEI